MDTINRLTISRGPAAILYNGATFFSKGDVVLDFGREIKSVESSAYGKLFDFETDIKPKLRFTPVGEWESLSVLFPYSDTVPGTSIFGTSDTSAKLR